MPRGVYDRKRAAGTPSPTNAQLIDAAKKNGFVPELDTSQSLTATQVDTAIITWHSALADGLDERAAMTRVLAPFAAPFDEAKSGWIVLKDSTIGLSGGPVRFVRGQHITDKALAGELQRAGVEIRPAA